MAGETPKSETPTKKTPSELMANAKVQVSGAATDVVNAVKSYGKPDGESGVGHYVGKAEDYLHQIHSPSDQPPTAVVEGADKKVESVVVVAEGADEKKTEPVVVAAEAEGAEKKADESPAVEGGETKVESTGGVGGLINKAKGLFKS